MCFGHNTRVRLGCGVRKNSLRSVVWQRRALRCLPIGCYFGLVVRLSVVGLISYERFV